MRVNPMRAPTIVLLNSNSFYLFQKLGILDADTLDCFLPETNRLCEDLFDRAVLRMFEDGSF